MNIIKQIENELEEARMLSEAVCGVPSEMPMVSIITNAVRYPGELTPAEIAFEWAKEAAREGDDVYAEYWRRVWVAVRSA